MLHSTTIGAILLLGLGLIPGDPPTNVATPEEEAEYQAASARVGRDSDAQVALALWCEAHGKQDRAMRHLALAVLIDPDNESARRLLGQVRRDESWSRPDSVIEHADDDQDRTALREEYEGRRSRLNQTADDHWKLALWCERSGLADEAKAHFTAVTRIEPGREAAWKRIGYIKCNGRWVTDAQIESARREVEARAAAEAEWGPRLVKWAEQLQDPALRDESLLNLSKVDHPLLVPAVWAVFVTGTNANQPVAAQVLGQINERDASRALATLAVYSDDADVRKVATESLKRRDFRDWADLLIGMIRKPIQYSVRPVNGPGSAGELFVEGKLYNFRRVYAAPPPPVVPMMPGDQMVMGADGLPELHRYSWFSASTNSGLADSLVGAGFNPFSPERQALVDRLANSGANPQLVQQFSRAAIPEFAPEVIDRTNGRPILREITTRSASITGIRTLQIPVGQEMLETQRASAMVGEQLQRDVQSIEAVNAPIRQLNDWVVPVLEDVTRVRHGAEPDAWRSWWLRQIGLDQVLPKPENGTSTFTDVFTIQPRQVAPQVNDNLVAVMQRQTTTLTDGSGCECLGKGTPVHTINGIRPIEEIRIGDRVLSQNPQNGALEYRPVTASYHNPPSTTFEIQIGDETIVSSDFHRFWVAGQGWVMARDLKAGDSVRLLQGQAIIEDVREGQVQPVFNLDVADNRSFLIGQAGTIVHDFSIPSATIDPFDAVPDLAALTGKSDPASGE